MLDHINPKRLCALMQHKNNAVRTPALRCAGNIVTGDDMQTQLMINAGLLKSLLFLLKHSSKKPIKKETCWTISNITAGSPDQIASVLDANLFVPLIEILASGEDFDIQKEAAWAVSNATSGGSDDQIRRLVQMGVMAPLCTLLTCKDAKVINVCVEALDNILRVGLYDAQGDKTRNSYADYLESCDGIAKLEQLQHHANQEIFDKCQRLLKTYFVTDDGAVNGAGAEDLGPQVAASGQTYTFGSSSAGGFGALNPAQQAMAAMGGAAAAAGGGAMFDF